MNHYDFSKYEPKAWINAIADEGTKQEMIWWLYEVDAERDRLAAELMELKKAPSPEERNTKDAARYRFLAHYMFEHIAKMFNHPPATEVELSAMIDSMAEPTPPSQQRG